DNQHVLVSSQSHTIKVYSIQTGQLEHALEGHSGRVSALSVAAGAPVFASASSEDKTRKIWDLRTHTCIRSFVCKGKYSGWNHNLVITPDGTRGISDIDLDPAIDGPLLRVWDVVTGATLATLIGHAFNIMDFAVSRDGTRLLSASQDRTAILWDLKTGARIRTFVGH